MHFSDMVLGIAGWVAPAERSNWFKAMQAEQEALQSGRLRWALGCVGVATGWRLAKDGIYVALICGALWFMENDPLIIPIIQLWGITVVREYMQFGLYPELIYMLLICLVLGVYRPKLVVFTSVAIILTQEAWGLYHMYFVMFPRAGIAQEGAWEFFQTLSIHDAKPLIGVCADFGACLGGGLIGRSIADRSGLSRQQARAS